MAVVIDTTVDEIGVCRVGAHNLLSVMRASDVCSRRRGEGVWATKNTYMKIHEKLRLSAQTLL